MREGSRRLCRLDNHTMNNITEYLVPVQLGHLCLQQRTAALRLKNSFEDAFGEVLHHLTARH